MYIPEFWCGVATVIVVEVIAAVIYGFYSNAKEDKKEK